jgi:peptidoglycan/xylan/chitin deacetylase (PgdA/CDA1 family)
LPSRVRRSRILAALGTRARAQLLRVVGVPLSWLLRRLAEAASRPAGVALVYHRVGDPPGNPRRELVPALGSALFAAQVRHLTRRYRLVGASELLDAIHEHRRGTPFPIAITFDDDLASHADVAAPILADLGATATFFVSGASLARPFRFWWERLQAAVDEERDLADLGLRIGRQSRAIHAVGLRIQNLPPYERDDVAAKLGKLVGPDPETSGLRSETLERLARHEVEIGFHTRRHDLLPLLGDEQLAEAMRAGRDEIEDVVGRPLRTMSYPHGAADARVAAAAHDAGFDFGFTGVPEVATEEADPLLLGRLSPSNRSLGELAFDVSWALLRTALSDRARARPARRGRS